MNTYYIIMNIYSSDQEKETTITCTLILLAGSQPMH